MNIAKIHLYIQYYIKFRAYVRNKITVLVLYILENLEFIDLWYTRSGVNASTDCPAGVKRRKQLVPLRMASLFSVKKILT